MTVSGNSSTGSQPTPCCFICSPPWKRESSAKPCRTMWPTLQLAQAQTGVEWIHRVIDGLTQKALRKVPPGKKWWKNGKKTTLTFRWERDELAIDNKDTMLAWNKYPYFSINLTLALRMGWVEKTGAGDYQMERNLLMELQDPQGDLPNPADDQIWDNAGWSFSSSHPMIVNGQSVYLSNGFNWRFARLNEASGRTLVPEQEVMFSGLFTLEKPGQPSIHVMTKLRANQLQNQTLITNGVDLMWSVVWAFEKEAFSQAQTRGITLKNSTRVTFHWEGETSGNHSWLPTCTSWWRPPRRWRWGGWAPTRPNWERISTTPCLTTCPPIPSSLPRRWRLDKMISGRWRKGICDSRWSFADYVGSPLRRFFVYCDLLESNRVGCQLHPMIRRVHFPQNGQGVHYFEPLHRQWMPLRRSRVDTVEEQLADPTRTLAKLKKGHGIKTSPSPSPSITHHERWQFDTV